MRYAVLLLILLTAPTWAQTPGTCEHGEAVGILDANDVLAGVFTNGNLFHKVGRDIVGPGYVVPQARRCHRLFSGETVNCSPVYLISPWIGGEVNGDVRMALNFYNPPEFWPGVLQPDARLPNPADCSFYDRIFVVSRSDVLHYLQTGEATDDLRDWPVSWGAPVLDGDGIVGNYDLDAGDQPAIYGEQTAWWVMNDVGNEHHRSETLPLGIEIQVAAFAAQGDLVPLRRTTYYRYRFINRNSSPIEDAYVAFLVDMGSGINDYIAADTLRDMAYIYNDNTVDGHYDSFPSVGLQVVQGPVGLPNGLDDDRDGLIDEQGERHGMTALVPMTGTWPVGKPKNTQSYYWRMRGRWNDGDPITEYGHGHSTNGQTTTFFWPGDPVEGAFWSALNYDGAGSQVAPTYWLFNISTGPFRLEAGEAAEIVLAIPFALSSSWQSSVRELRSASEIIRSVWDSGSLMPTRVELEPSGPVVFQLQVSTPFPNPFTDQTTIRYEVPEAMRVRMVVYDALGREVAVLVDAEQQAGSYEAVFDGEGLAPGTYIVRFEAAGEERSFSVVKLR